MKKIIGIGNALTDILLKLQDDSALQQLNLPKGSMQLVGIDRQEQISNYLLNAPRTMISGGSASNTVNGTARLGVYSGFIGKVAEDEIGEFYKEDTINNGVHLRLLKSNTPSGRCFVLISPEGERTMCTFLGAASELHPDDLNISLFNGYDIFHIEGYLVQNHELISRAVRLAKEANLTVSIDLASYNIVHENLSFLKESIIPYIDILFSNEEEAKAFTGKEPLDALDEFAELVQIAVVKIGKKGSYIKCGDSLHTIHSTKVHCVDSTGAGDLYASGFLYGFACGYPLEICGHIGSIVAENIIQVVGAKMDDEHWKLVQIEIEKLLKSYTAPNLA